MVLKKEIPSNTHILRVPKNNCEILIIDTRIMYISILNKTIPDQHSYVPPRETWSKVGKILVSRVH
jgi:hypothetical protein